MENPTLGLAFLAGLLSFISPCVLPLVPAYISYMGGRMTRTVSLQLAASGAEQFDTGLSAGARFNTLLNGAAFVLGFTLVFVSIGLMTTALVGLVGGAVGTLTLIIGRVGGMVIILFGLHFMGALPVLFRWLRSRPALLQNPLLSLAVAAAGTALILWGFVEPLIGLPVAAAFLLALGLGGAFTQPGLFWPRLLNTLEQWFYTDTRREMRVEGRQGLGGSLLMGVVFSAGWTPCIGPLLGAILTVAANTGDAGSALPLLTVYSLGLGLPFMLTALLLDGAQGVLRRLQQHMRKIELLSGALLIFIGLLVMSGQLRLLTENLGNETADVTYRIEECVIGFFQGELHASHVGSCVGGTLVPAAVGQVRSVSLSGETPVMEIVFRSTEGTQIEVLVGRVPEGAVPLVTLYDPQDIELAQGQAAPGSEERAVVGPIVLAADGVYRVYVENAAEIPTDERLTFRVRVQHAAAAAAQTVVDLTGGGTAQEEGESAVSALLQAGIGGIEELAAEVGPIEGREVGNLAPDFMVITTGGETLKLSELRGQVVLLNFWGTWCAPCRREMPEFQRAYETQGENGFTIVALAVRDNAEDVEAFRREFGLSFTLALDEGDNVSRLYGVQVQPSTFIIDASGVIRFRHFGVLTEDQIQQLVDDALS